MKEYNSVEQLHGEKKKSFFTILYVIVTIIAFILLFTKCTNLKQLNKFNKPLGSPIVWNKIVDSLNFPEGPAWNKENGILYFSNCYGGWISKVKNNKVDTFLVATKNPFSFYKTNGMTIHNGYLYACDFGKGVILKISTNGKTETYVDGYKGKNFNRPNDLAFDEKGNLYFTDPQSYGKDKLDGRVFMIKADTREVVLVEDSLAFPNGIAFTANGKNLVVCESAKNRILKFNVEPDGKLYNKTEFIVLSGGDPDGIALDNDGNLYVAHFGAGYLWVINPQGKIIQKIKTPGLKPTNIEFGGEDMKTLFLTEVETNSLYKIRTKIPGILLN